MLFYPFLEAWSAPQVLDIYFKDNETVAFSWEEAITIEETGMYYLWFVVCDAELSAATVSGSTIWKNPTGPRPPGLCFQSRHLRREAPCNLGPAPPSVEQPTLMCALHRKTCHVRRGAVGRRPSAATTGKNPKLCLHKFVAARWSPQALLLRLRSAEKHSCKVFHS